MRSFTRIGTLTWAGAAVSLLSTAVQALEWKAKTQEIRLLAPPGGKLAVPKFEYGLLIFRHFDAPDVPHFTILDPLTGSTVAKIRAEAPEARETYPTALAVFPDRRRFVVSAATLNDSGKRSFWLLFYDAEGKRTHEQRISPFHPFLLAVAPDNTVWGVGSNARTIKDSSSTEPVLYRWDEKGNLLNKLLEQRQFASEEFGSPGETVQGLGSSAIVTSRERVVLYDAGSGVLAEVSTSGQVLGVYKPPRRHLRSGKPASGRGLAVTDDGEIYASFDTVCRFDRRSQVWMPVEDVPGLSGDGSLYGSWGNIVLRRGESGDRFHFRLVTLE
ncbi:MAG: hypothetical protein WHT08_13610 [Bryobacteraceae bacterium]